MNSFEIAVLFQRAAIERIRLAMPPEFRTDYHGTNQAAAPSTCYIEVAAELLSHETHRAIESALGRISVDDIIATATKAGQKQARALAETDERERQQIEDARKSAVAT